MKGRKRKVEAPLLPQKFLWLCFIIYGDSFNIFQESREEFPGGLREVGAGKQILANICMLIKCHFIINPQKRCILGNFI